MQAYAIHLNCCWWLTLIQILQTTVVIVWRPNHLLMSSVVGWKRSRRRVAWNTTRCPGITQKFMVCWQHLLAKSMKVSCPGPNCQTRFYQHFQRSHRLSVGLRPPSWLSESQYKFSREKFVISHSKYNVLSLFLAHHISSLFNITWNSSSCLQLIVNRSDAWILSSVNI